MLLTAAMSWDQEAGFSCSKTCTVLDWRLLQTDGAIVDLNGHFVTCTNFVEDCIILSGAGVQLFDGVVRGAFHVNLRIEGNGHTVKNITSGPTDGDVVLIGDNNRLINVTSRSAVNPALRIGGDNNQVSNSIAQCGEQLFPTSGCIDVSGDTNRLSNNFVTLRVGGTALSIGGNVHSITRHTRWAKPDAINDPIL
jgi:hypothetical protein